jgi:carbon-monoxide dehydrogenase large subunit
VTRRYFGERVLRREDARFVTGRGQYLDNIPVRGALHMVVVRSPFAHARIGEINLKPALDAPGVVAAFTGDDLRPQWGAPLPMMWPVTDDVLIPEHWPLAVGESKFAGDGVAVVLARTFAQAKDAAELVDVEYDPLPSVTDMDEALTEGAPLVHPEFGTNRCYHLAYANGDRMARSPTPTWW